MRAAGKAWKALAADLGIAESTAIYHANRVVSRPLPPYRPVVATLTLAGLRVSELCALNCEHVDLARRELRVLHAKTPAGVRRVDVHDDLQDELAAYKAARSATWQPGTPAFLNARGKRWTRNAVAQHVMPPALKEADRQRGPTEPMALRLHGDDRRRCDGTCRHRIGMSRRLTPIDGEATVRWFRPAPGARGWHTDAAPRASRRQRWAAPSRRFRGAAGIRPRRQSPRPADPGGRARRRRP